jgi:hypothetical protein
MIGLTTGVIAYMLWSWVAASNGPIGGALLQLAGTAVIGGSLACATVFVQRRAARRVNIRHEEGRRIRIARERNPTR